MSGMSGMSSVAGSGGLAVRTPGTTLNFNAPTTPNQPSQPSVPQLSLEEQIALIELQRADPKNPYRDLLPPTQYSPSQGKGQGQGGTGQQGGGSGLPNFPGQK